MTARVFGALLVLCALGCRPSPAPSAPSDFFEPIGASTNQAPPEHPVPDFSWWFGERAVVVHPISTSVDDEFWYDWEGRINRVASDPESTREDVRAEQRRFAETPGIFGGLLAAGPEKEGRAAKHGVSIDEFNEDQWVALGSPFDHDAIHIYQLPIYDYSRELRSGQLTYVTQDLVLATHSGRSVDIIFAPEAVRAGQTKVIPEPYMRLFDATSVGRVYSLIEVAFLYPSYQETIVEDYAIANDGPRMVRRFEQAGSTNLRYYEEAAND